MIKLNYTNGDALAINQENVFFAKYFKSRDETLFTSIGENKITVPGNHTDKFEDYPINQEENYVELASSFMGITNKKDLKEGA